MPVPTLRSKLPKIVWDSKVAAVVLEDNLGLKDGEFFSNWTITGSGPATDPTNLGWWDENPTSVDVTVSALFSWVPADAPFVRESTATRVITGLTPGTGYGFTLNTNWAVHTGGWGKFQVIINGKVYEMPTLGNNLWNFGTVDTTSNRYLRGVADEDGNVEIQLRFYEFRPSFFVAVFLGEGQFAEMGPSSLLYVMPPENLDVYPKALEPQEQNILPSGLRDGWEADWADHIECTVRAIPPTGGLGDGTAWWGWQGGGGWNRFLEYASVGGQFKYYPDQTDDLTFYECVFTDDAVVKPDKDWDGHRQIQLKFRAIDSSPIVGY